MTDQHDHDHVRPATAAERADVAAMHAANRAAWDEAAERYEGWFDEAVELIRSGGTNLFGVEIELIGDLHGRCRRAIHLQCAGGRDTLSLWNQGADEVVGVDFSPRMLELAPAPDAQATGAPARWIQSDVLDTPHELDGTADLVYTGRGSLIWLQDLDAWAAVIARLLAPAGRFVLFEGHPAEWLFDVDEDGRWIATDYDYFGGPEASKGWAPEYIDRLSIDDADQSWKFARAWTLGEVVTALLGADLRLEAVAEHPVDWWGGHGDVRDDERGRIPLSFSVVGRKGPRLTPARLRARRSDRDQLREPRRPSCAVDGGDGRRSPSARSGRRCAGTASPRRRSATGRRARRGPRSAPGTAAGPPRSSGRTSRRGRRPHPCSG